MTPLRPRLARLLPSHALLTLAAACSLLLATALPSRLAAADPPAQSGGAFVPDEVLVKFAPSVSPGSIDRCLRSANAPRRREIADIHVSRLKVPAGTTAQAITRLQACPGVVYAELNYEIHAVDTLPDDPYLSLQYGLNNIRAPQGWDLSTGSAGVTIAIVDSGIDLTHADLAAKIVPGYDFVNLDDLPQDDYGHGTHVAGIAGAVTNNGIGVAGVSWGARLMPVKVLNSSGNGSFADLAEGLTWAADQGAQVINMSLGGTASPAPQTMLDAVNYAYGKGAVMVAAAGNNARNEAFYPADFDHVIAVAATDSANLRAGFSDYGLAIDLAAPGVSIYSTLPGDAYGPLSGTSMAAPFVAGLAAVLRGLPGNTSPDQIMQELETSALDLGDPGRDDFYGYGLIQADAAILSTHALTMSVSGSGAVTSAPAGIDCGPSCLARFTAGTPVTLTAVPALGGAFLGWSDPACPGTAPCTLTLAADTAIEARFTYVLYFPLVFRE